MKTKKLKKKSIKIKKIKNSAVQGKVFETIFLYKKI